MMGRANVSIEEEEEDRISNLPDEIICKILSLLPGTKYVFRTSVLSRRWLNLWTQVPVIDFGLHYNDNNTTYDAKFDRFVDKVLSTNTLPVIQKFRLFYPINYDIDIRRINNWLKTVTSSRKVIELDLLFGGFSSEEDDEDVLIGSLLSQHCKSIPVLTINSYVGLKVSDFQGFVNLRNLYLTVCCVDNELTSKFFTCLPQLEELTISLGDVTNCSHLNIVTPLLKVLNYFVWSSGDNKTDLQVLIDAPMLKYMQLTDTCCLTIHLRMFHQMREQ